MKTNVIGVRHRQKMTKENEARPTMLCIAPAGDPSNTRELQLGSEQDEIDWAHGNQPIIQKIFSHGICNGRRSKKTNQSKEFLILTSVRKVRSSNDWLRFHQSTLV
jgi:hypothetical protein